MNYELREIYRSKNYSQPFWKGRDRKEAERIAAGQLSHEQQGVNAAHFIGLYRRGVEVYRWPTVNARLSTKDQKYYRARDRFSTSPDEFHIVKKGRKKTEAKNWWTPEKTTEKPFSLNNHKQFEDHEDTLSDSQKHAVQSYKANSEPNEPLRKRQGGLGYNYIDDLARYYPTISALNKVTSYKIKEPLTVYRGIRTFAGPANAWDPENLEPGTQLQDHGFVSTSLNQETPKGHFVGQKMHPSDGIFKNIMFQIHLPVGTKAHYVDNDNAPSNDLKGENEVLLNPGHIFEVTHHSAPDDHTHLVHLKVVGHDPFKLQNIEAKRLKSNLEERIESKYMNHVTNGSSMTNNVQDILSSHEALSNLNKEHGFIPNKHISSYAKAVLNDDIPKSHYKKAYDKLEENIKKKNPEHNEIEAEEVQADLDRMDKIIGKSGLSHSPYIANVAREIPRHMFKHHLRRLTNQINTLKSSHADNEKDPYYMHGINNSMNLLESHAATHNLTIPNSIYEDHKKLNEFENKKG